MLFKTLSPFGWPDITIDGDTSTNITPIGSLKSAVHGPIPKSLQCLDIYIAVLSRQQVLTGITIPNPELCVFSCFGDFGIQLNVDGRYESNSTRSVSVYDVVTSEKHFAI